MSPEPPEPAASRPLMPGYGIAPLDAGGGPLPWAWAQARLQRARNYWLATTRPNGAAHLAAVWGVWLAEGIPVGDDGVAAAFSFSFSFSRAGFAFSTGARSQKAANLAGEPRCVITPESGAESVVVEGVAERVEHAGALAGIEAVYRAKYGAGFPDPGRDPVFLVRPVTVIAVIDHEPEFTGRATRWRLASS